MSTCDFLLIGCEGCGKTTLLKQLGNFSRNTLGDASALNTLSTNGVELETITYKKHKYVVREIGGNFLPVWPKYYESALMVIYMIDMANSSQLSITCVEFLNLLCNKGLYRKNVLLLLNKIDQPFAMSRSVLEGIMFLESAKKEAFSRFGQTIWVEEISAVKGTGLDKVLFWMHDTKRSIAPSGSPKGSPRNSPKGPTSNYSPKGIHPLPSFSHSFAHNAIYERALKLDQSSNNNNNINFINTSYSSPDSAVNVNVNINTNTNINNNNNNKNNNNTNNETSSPPINPEINVSPTINIFTNDNVKVAPSLSSSHSSSSSSSSTSSSSPVANIFVSNNSNSIPDGNIAIKPKIKKTKKKNTTNITTNINTNTNINNNNDNNNDNTDSKPTQKTTKTKTKISNDNNNNNNNNNNTNINLNNVDILPNTILPNVPAGNSNININNNNTPTTNNNKSNSTVHDITHTIGGKNNNPGPIITDAMH